MAKITAPFLALGASGTIGKTLTASKWRGRPYIRQRVIPSNPKTVEQTKTRDIFAWSNSVWKLMGTLATTPWDRFADGQVLTGRNKFQGETVANSRGDADLNNFTFSIGAKGGIPPTSIVWIPAPTTLTGTFTNPVAPTGWILASAIGVAIEQQDPQSGVLFRTFEDEDLLSANPVVITGLSSTKTYRVGGFLRWTKPDLSIAYSAAVMDVKTTT